MLPLLKLGGPVVRALRSLVRDLKIFILSKNTYHDSRPAMFRVMQVPIRMHVMLFFGSNRRSF